MFDILFYIFTVVIIPMIWVLQKCKYGYIFVGIVICIYFFYGKLISRYKENEKPMIIRTFVSYFVLTLTMIPILNYGLRTIRMFFYHGRKGFSYLFVFSLILYISFSVKTFRMMRHSDVIGKILLLVPIILVICVCGNALLQWNITGIRRGILHLYQNLKYRDVIHYEIEYHSYDLNEVTLEKNYDKMHEKYKIPLKVTWGEFKNDFGYDEEDIKSSAIYEDEIMINDSEEIWVYSSCYKDYTNEILLFEYDQLEINEGSVEIKTHFEVLEGASHTGTLKDLIIVSIIPVNQG